MFYKMMLGGQPTMSEWPIRIERTEDIKPQFEKAVLAWLKEPFDSYDFVYAPKRPTNPASYAYLFGYGNDKIFYMREESNKLIEISKQNVTAVMTERELLNAKIIVRFQEGSESKNLEFPYVPSVYYLYDPFLNWLLGLEKKFLPMTAERENPRPRKLYEDSLVMFNYSLGAYRLGAKFEKYDYKSMPRRRKWMPWKKDLEEWLEIPMEHGIFRLHSFKYLTECGYEIRKTCTDTEE